jgi:hypothetical protein
LRHKNFDMDKRHNFLSQHSFLKILNPENILNTLFFFSLSAFIVLSIFNYPSADDYFFTLKSQNLGVFASVIDWYKTWTGRYFSSFVMSINPLVFNNYFLYRIIPILLLITLYATIYMIFNLIFPIENKKEKLFYSNMLMLMYLFQMPNVCQGFYWLSGSITYQLANVFTVLFLFSLIKLLTLKENKYLALNIILAIAIIGSNETSMLSLDFLVGLIFLFDLYLKRKINKSLVLLLFIMLTFSAIVYFAPGNQVRADHSINKYELVESTIQTVKTIKSFLIKWLPLNIIFILLLINMLEKSEVKNKINQQLVIFNINPIVGILSILGLLFVGFFPGFWSMGNCPPSRAINVIYLFFTLSLTYSILNIHFYLKNKNLNSISINQTFTYLFLIIIAIEMYKTNNIKTAVKDLLQGKAYGYYLQVKARNLKIASCNNDTCYVAPFSNTPTTIFCYDITSDPNHWCNESYARYNKKKYVILTDRKNGLKGDTK